MTDFSGVYPPVLTPFKSDGSLDLPALVFNLEKYASTGLRGFILLGSFGESVHLYAQEKLDILRAARRVIPKDQLLIAGTGLETTAATIRLIRQAADLGADVALVMTPHFYDPLLCPDILVGHFRRIADASPIPVLLYNVPLFTHVDLPVESIVALSAHENIPGMKESSGDVVKIGKILEKAPPFQVLTGSGSAFLGALTIGAVGGVMGIANLAPKEMVRLMKLALEGKFQEAASIQRRVLALDHAITFTHGIAGAKSALDLLGYMGGSVRLPLVDLDEQGKTSIHEMLRSARLIEK